MGLRSGLYGGRNRNQAPTACRVSAAAGALWLDRLSRSEAPNATGPSERAEHVAFAQRRPQLGFDVEGEHLAVHHAVDHPWCFQPVVAQGGDEGLGPPVAERGVIDEALPARCPAGGLGHVGLDRRLVEESQSFQMVGHEGLALRDPDVALISDILALLLKRLKVFFCASGRAPAAPAKRCRDEPRCHASRTVPRPIRRA